MLHQAIEEENKYRKGKQRDTIIQDILYLSEDGESDMQSWFQITFVLEPMSEFLRPPSCLEVPSLLRPDIRFAWLQIGKRLIQKEKQQSALRSTSMGVKRWELKGERGGKEIGQKRGLQVCCHALVSGFYFVGQKEEEKIGKIPLSAPPSLLLKSAPCVFELAPGVEEKSRIRGKI